jgi:ABC-type sugar transport system permease subunit
LAVGSNSTCDARANPPAQIDAAAEGLPVAAITTAFRAVDAFTKAFDIILATTGGGPGQATMVFPLYVWRTAFVSLHFGEASALAVIAIVISGAIGACLLALNRRAGR